MNWPGGCNGDLTGIPGTRSRGKEYTWYVRCYIEGFIEFWHESILGGSLFCNKPSLDRGILLFTRFKVRGLCSLSL